MEITEKSSSRRGKLFSVYTFLSSGKVLPIIILVVLPASAILIYLESGIDYLVIPVIFIMVVLYAPYRAAYSSEKYFKRRGYGNVINEYFVIKHILYFAIPMFIFLEILPLAPVIKIIVDALLTPTFVSLLTYLSLWIVIAGLTKIILQIAKKEFRLNFAIGCIRFLAREEDEIDKMKYVIWGLDSYNAYLRRYLKLEIGNLKMIYSKISVSPLGERAEFKDSLDKSFDISKLEPLQVLSRYLNSKEKEHLLVKESSARKIKEAAAFIAIVVPILISLLQALGIIGGSAGG